MSEVSLFYRAGMCYQFLVWASNEDISIRKAIAIYLTARAVAEVVSIIVDEMESLGEELERTRAGPPPIPPLKQSELSMPDQRPAPRSTAAWPPFTGVRVDLGGGGA